MNSKIVEGEHKTSNNFDDMVGGKPYSDIDNIRQRFMGSAAISCAELHREERKTGALRVCAAAMAQRRITSATVRPGNRLGVWDDPASSSAVGTANAARARV